MFGCFYSQTKWTLHFIKPFPPHKELFSTNLLSPMLHWQQLLLVVAQGHLSSSSFPFMAMLQSNYSQEFVETYNRNHWCAVSNGPWNKESCENRYNVCRSWLPHENKCTVCSITTNMISLLSLLPFHTTLHCTVCKRVSCFSKAVFLLDPWLAIQHPTKRNSPPRWAPRQRMLLNTNFQAGWASETPKLPQYHKSDSSKHVSKKLI